MIKRKTKRREKNEKNKERESINNMVSLIVEGIKDLDYFVVLLDKIEEVTTEGFSNREWEDAFNNAKLGNFDKIPPKILVKYYLNLKEARIDYIRSNEKHECCGKNILEFTIG